MYVTKQINIFAEYRGIPESKGHGANMGPIRVFGLWRQARFLRTSFGLGIMSRYSAQILIYVN